MKRRFVKATSDFVSPSLFGINPLEEYEVVCETINQWIILDAGEERRFSKSYFKETTLWEKKK